MLVEDVLEDRCPFILSRDFLEEMEEDKGDGVLGWSGGNVGGEDIELGDERYVKKVELS